MKYWGNGGWMDKKQYNEYCKNVYRKQEETSRNIIKILQEKINKETERLNYAIKMQNEVFG